MLLLPLLAAAGGPGREERAVGAIALSPSPYLPGSRLRVAVDGFPPPYTFGVLGIGSIERGVYRVPSDAPAGDAALIAGNAAGLALGTLRVAAPPDHHQSAIVVASYDAGLVFHDPRSFGVRGILAVDGAPSDVAIAPPDRVVASDTQGDTLTSVTLNGWHVAHVPNVPLGDEVAVDPASRAVFVTDRDVNGRGALTQIAANGTVRRVVTGATAEGLAVDPRRGRVYVANVNDDTVAVVDTRSMHIVQRFRAVARVFSLALSPDGTRLYAVSNQSVSSPFATPGRVVAIALGPHPHRIASSAPLTFPLGIASDPLHHRLFVTDEASNEIDVLDARTLKAQHPPLATCTTPWKPYFDPQTSRLYVPCARADAIDVFDARSLHRVRGAPFATGGYPLAVAVWHPR